MIQFCMTLKETWILEAIVQKKKSSKLPLTLTCCLFFLFCLFFLLYLKLQRSDDDAENAL